MSRVTHFEIHVENPEQAMEFYRTCFSWKFQQFGDNPYWVIITGSDDKPGINGGMLPRKGDIHGQAVIAYVCTIEIEDIGKTTAIIEANGGTMVVPKMPIPGVGWLSYFKDTEGNIFGISQPDPSAK